MRLTPRVRRPDSELSGKDGEVKCVAQQARSLDQRVGGARGRGALAHAPAAHGGIAFDGVPRGDAQRRNNTYSSGAAANVRVA